MEADLIAGAEARSAEGERLNTEPPSRDRPIRDRPNRELFTRERARLEFRALLAPPGPPSMPSPRRVPNLTLAALPPSAPAIVPPESPGPRREPLAANAVPSEPLWPSFSRGSRLAEAGPRGPLGPREPCRPPARPSPLPRSDSRSRGVLPPLTCLIAPWVAPAGLRAAGMAQAARSRWLRGVPARRSAAAAANSTNGHSSTS